MTKNTRAAGMLAEARAMTYLCDQGLTLVKRNYQIERASKRYEIDLIMRDQEYWVFVEVRMRLNPNFGNSLETINRHKQSLIIKAAQYYLVENQLWGQVDCRFDAVGIDHNQKITWIRDAFAVQYR
jgi:putative endonuclease